MTKAKSQPTNDALASNDPPPVATVTRETLEATPGRMLPFLRAIGTSRAIRGLMMSVGYTAADHQKGWTLLHAVSGYSAGAELDDTDATVRDAIAAIDAYDEDFFRILRSALSHHPEQAAFVLQGLSASVGPKSVLGVKQVLLRLDELEKGEDRKATRKADHAALATLAKRRIDEKERARLAALVADAESSGGDEPAPTAEDATQTDEEHVRALTALRAWYEDWSEMARVAVKRRDYLIRMGLANRKGAKKTKAAAGDPKPPSP
jgi:hypothetical protein